MSPCDPIKASRVGVRVKTMFTTLGGVRNSRLATPEVLQDLTGLYQKI